MSYEAQCPKGHRLQVTEAHFDKQVNCPTCGTPFVVPNLAAAAQPAAAGQPAAAAMVQPLGRTYKSGGSSANGLTGLAGMLGRPMLGIGLILVILARGCDTIGQRGVESAQMKPGVAETELTASWDKSIRNYTREIAKLEKEKKAENETKIKDLTERRSKAIDSRKEGVEEFRATKGPDLELAAELAAAKNQSWAYWREWVFVLATIVLTVGLLSVSLIAQGAERMVCLVMLAIIAFSIFIGGIAWIPFPKSFGSPIRSRPSAAEKFGVLPGVNDPAEAASDETALHERQLQRETRPGYLTAAGMSAWESGFGPAEQKQTVRAAMRYYAWSPAA